MARKNKGLKALILGVGIAGFGWMSVRGFADMWRGLTPGETMIIGLLGIVILTWIGKQLGIKKADIF